jgi:hypothetical protein
MAGGVLREPVFLATLRVGLVPPLVLLCHAVEWTTWRWFLTNIFGYCLHMAGIPFLRLSLDTFACNGHLFHFAISCTILDAFFGSIPLLWEPTKNLRSNLAFLATYFVCLSVVNLARLQSGFVLYVYGVPWWLSHEVMSGVFYFGLFCWISHRRGWLSFFAPVPPPSKAVMA